MMKRLAFAAVTIAAVSVAARSPEPEPQPEPAQIEQLLASLGTPAAPPPKVQEKLAKADSLVTAMDRSEPSRLAGAAERLLAR